MLNFNDRHWNLIDVPEFIIAKFLTYNSTPDTLANQYQQFHLGGGVVRET